MKIAVVVPTIRPHDKAIFETKWIELFIKHYCTVFYIHDGETPEVEQKIYFDKIKSGGKISTTTFFQLSEFILEVQELIYKKNDGVRNLGFLMAAARDYEVIITLDDDCYPIEGTDPIQDHLDILGQKRPVSWISTATDYMRGFPYGVRDEAKVVVSHGVWDGVPDLDGATQLVKGISKQDFPKMVIPKGIYFPFCIMNVAFLVEALPYMYQAPMGFDGFDRFADIWSGINLKRDLDSLNLAVATGYSKIYHSRASNVFKNIQKEAKGLELNENYWKGEESDPYFKLYNEKRNKWKKLTTTLLSSPGISKILDGQTD